jgi:hypothetical protein
MTCAYHTVQSATGTNVWTLQHPQHGAGRTIGNRPRRTQISDLYVAFRIPHAYDFITELCRWQGGVVQNYGNGNADDIGQSKAGPTEG